MDYGRHWSIFHSSIKDRWITRDIGPYLIHPRWIDGCLGITIRRQDVENNPPQRKQRFSLYLNCQMKDMKRHKINIIFKSRSKLYYTSLKIFETVFKTRVETTHNNMTKNLTVKNVSGLRRSRTDRSLSGICFLLSPRRVL